MTDGEWTLERPTRKGHWVLVNRNGPPIRKRVETFWMDKRLHVRRENGVEVLVTFYDKGWWYWLRIPEVPSE